MKKVWVLSLLILSLILQGCVTSNPYQNGSTEKTESSHSDSTLSSDTSVTTATSDPTQAGEDSPSDETSKYVYYSQGAKNLLAYLSTKNPHYLKLINKTENEFGAEDFVPADLIPLNTAVTPEEKEIELEKRTAQALYAMLAEMEYDGITDIKVTSGYRSLSYQKELYNYYIKKEMETFSSDAFAHLGFQYINNKYDINTEKGLDLYDAKQVVLSYSAYPGTSEHQTGLCVDFITLNMTALTNVFEQTPAFAWLSENAHRFGFILRYPKDKTTLTGYAYESWHYRYVGRDAATEIFENGWTLEQYREYHDKE